ncbi:MAG: RsmE family RNA methyltransferase [Oscillospiraceae bacterium]
MGSEGGFSPKEAELLAEKGALSVGLGKRILRCETAAVAAAALVMYSLGELE